MNNDLPGQISRFMTEVLDEPKALRWLGQFDPETVTPFLTSYYIFRTCWINFGDVHLQNKEKYVTMHLEEAEAALEMILQKKLFDLQCQWRAEQLKLPGIQHSMQFIKLGFDVQNVDFVPPITTEEVELLKVWLQNPDSNIEPPSDEGWQDYNKFAIARKDELADDFPAFFKFMDAQQGQTSLWDTLENTRGGKEFHYFDARMQQDLPAMKAEAANRLPSLLENEGYMGEFANVFEDRITNDRRIAMEQSPEVSERILMDALHLLKETKTPVPVEANDDWRQAVIAGAAKLRRQRLLNALDVAWENYQFRQKNHIGLPIKEIAPVDRLRLQQHETYGIYILEGRELLGEPKDFNF